MTDASHAVPATCPHCGSAVAGGRFCSACGKELDLHATASAVFSDAIGVKRVSLAAYLRTAWLAVAAPATLTQRWMRGERVGLVSPVAMMGVVTLVTGIAGFLLTRWTGTREAAVVLDIGPLMDAAPFLRDRFPKAVTAAALDGKALTEQLRQVSGWFAAFFPSLLIVPGWLALAPWRRIDRRGALILAVVESVFLLILTGVHTSLKLVAPVLAGSTPTMLVFAAVVFGHGAFHVRGLTGSSWRYAISRPMLAAVLILPVAYLWLVVILTTTLAVWT